MFNPPDQYVWDFWTVQDQGVTHLFYLSAPRSLPDPEMRHANARCGHAVSRDLVHWTQLPIALEPGAAGSWDDRAIWTGSVCRAGDRWAMLYTGTNWAEDGKIQRVGYQQHIRHPLGVEARLGQSCDHALQGLLLRKALTGIEP